MPDMRRPEVELTDHRDRTGRVQRTLLADRAEQQALESRPPGMVSSSVSSHPGSLTE
jgi:hypothetical protein